MPISTLPNVLWADGQDNMGSLQTTVYYALRTEIATLNTPYTTATADDLNELGSISAEHTFESGKGWKKLYTTEDTGMVESTQQGELDGKSFINKLGFFHPGARGSFLGWARYVNNSGVIALGVDAEGLRRQVGSEQWPGHVSTMNITTTATGAGRKGTTGEITAQAPYPAPLYPYSLDLEYAS